jgi:chromosome segregation ATPase
MPADNYEMFAGLSDDEIKKRVPPQSVEEYLRHGKDVTTDDADVRKLGLDEAGKPLGPEDTATPAKEVYQRRLRDYSREFEEFSRRRVAMEVAKAETTADIARLTVALTTAKEMQAARESEIKRLNSDLANIKKERQAIDDHLALVQKQLARGQSLLADLLKRNAEMARQLAAAESRSTNRSNSAPSTPAPSAPLALGKAN